MSALSRIRERDETSGSPGLSSCTDNTVSLLIVIDRLCYRHDFHEVLSTIKVEHNRGINAISAWLAKKDSADTTVSLWPNRLRLQSTLLSPFCVLGDEPIETLR